MCPLIPINRTPDSFAATCILDKYPLILISIGYNYEYFWYPHIFMIPGMFNYYIIMHVVCTNINISYIHVISPITEDLRQTLCITI